MLTILHYARREISGNIVKVRKSDKFVEVVGRMPFSGRPVVRQAYMEGVRASVRGDRSTRANTLSTLGGYAFANTALAIIGGGIGAIAARYGANHNAMVFGAEAVGSALYGLGHLTSAVAQGVMYRRLRNIPIAQTVAPPEPYTMPPDPPPTLRERIVTDGGALLGIVPAVHIMLDVMISY